MQGNLAPYNVGPVLWVNDLAVPSAILIMLWVRRHLAFPRVDPPPSSG